MNKRPLGPTGLPAKPGYTGQPGPAPPLPPGPMPSIPGQPQPQAQGFPSQQGYGQPQYPQNPQQQQQQVDPAAHAAAWAAYYQATGQPNPYAQTTPVAGAGASPGGATTAFANYGYGAGAQHANHLQPGQPQVGQPPQQAYGYQYPQQPQQGMAPQTQGQAQIGPNQPGFRPSPTPYPQHQQQGGYGNYGPQQPAPNTGYRPPMGQQQGGYGYNSPTPGPGFQPQQPQPQPFYPQQQQQQQQQFRPPQQGPVRAYQPRPTGMPLVPGGGQGGVPPAKRPRFDGPGGMAPPIRPGPPGQGVNNGQPGFNAVGRPPIPRPGSATPSAPSTAPIVRPPIHLGMGGPPPPGVIVPRGPSIGGRGGLGGRGGRGGMMHVNVPGAPRGPAGMSGFGRRGAPLGLGKRYGGGGDREREREREKERERRREKERESRTTMTDFRIVGIQLKVDEDQGGGWDWGLVEDKAKELHPSPEAKEEVKAQAEVKEEAKDQLDVKTEQVEERNGSAEAEEKRGEKRKAKSPDGDEESGGASKKRAALTTDPIAEDPNPTNTDETTTEPAVKAETTDTEPKAKSEPTEPSTSSSAQPDGSSSSTAPPPPSAPTSKFEEPQNRFRIYFESPPELDRIPKAVRRGNKRWRRETSSVAPNLPVPEEGGEKVEEVDGGEEKKDEAEVVVGNGQATEEAEGEQKDSALPTDGIAAGSEAQTVDGVTAPRDDIPTGESSGDAPADPSRVAQSASVTTEEPAAGGSDETVIPGLPLAQDVDAFAPNPTEEVEEADTAADVGDVSMVTDASALAAGADEAKITENGVNQPDQPEASISDIPPIVVDPSSPKPDTSDPDPTLETAVPATTDVTSTEEAQAEQPEPETEPEATTTRRRRSISTQTTHTRDEDHDHLHDDHTDADQPASGTSIGGPQPSVNRISILYEESSRRICVDAEVVERVKIWRGEGKIEVCLKEDEGQEDGELRKGVLMEMYDTTDERFVALTSSRFIEIYPETDDPTPLITEESSSIPPLHRPGRISLIVWLNKKRPLSEPKWCRSNSADEWLFETFGSLKSTGMEGWRGKLEVMDPDPAPTLANILDGWVGTCSSGTEKARKEFISSLSADPHDLLEILLRLARGDRNPTINPASFPSSSSSLKALKPESPYANHQTHVSLAILQMYRLTVAYADKAGEGEGVKEKLEEIVRGLPVGMIQRSLDGLFREWGEKK